MIQNKQATNTKTFTQIHVNRYANLILLNLLEIANHYEIVVNSNYGDDFVYQTKISMQQNPKKEKNSFTTQNKYFS